MGKVDLHIHTIHSDGSKTPIEIIEMCRKSDVTTMAITDHDNIEGAKELVNNHPSDLRVYSGVELTIKVDKGRMHMLGYNIDLSDLSLNTYLNENKNNSIYNLLLYIEIIKKDFGIGFSNEEIECLISKKGNVGRPDIAVLLINKGICKSVDEAFKKYLIYAYQKAGKLKRGISYQEGIELIHGAGGVSILAHPNSLLLNNRELEDKVIEMKQLGLDGIESIHINENSQERRYYHYLATKHGLLETGGTDYHGSNKPNVYLGSGINNNVDIKPKQLSFVRRIETRYK